MLFAGADGALAPAKNMPEDVQENVYTKRCSPDRGAGTGCAAGRTTGFVPFGHPKNQD